MRNRQAGVAFILVTLFIDALGVGIIIPVLPRLVERFLGVGPEAASGPYGWLLAVYALMLFAFAPVWGAVSDTYGRRVVILVTLLGTAIDYAIMGLAGSYGILFIGRALAGMSGANITTGFAYIADVTTPANRGRGFGQISMAFGLGFILGPALGGLLGKVDPRLPFFVAGVLALVNWFYGLLVLPESLAADRRRSFSWRRANPLATLAQLGRFRLVLGLAAAYFLLQLASQMMQSTWVLYTEYRFGWDELAVGLSLAVVGLLSGIVMGRFTQPAARRFGEARVIRYGLLLMALGFVLWGLSTHSWMMYAVMVPYIVGCLCSPTLQSLMSQQVDPTEQGELQGGLTSLLSLAAILGPLAGSYTFGTFAKPTAELLVPGMAFFAGAVLFMLAWALATWVFGRGAIAVRPAAPQAAPP